MLTATLRLLSFNLLALTLSSCGFMEWKEQALNALVNRLPIEMEIRLGQQILLSTLPDKKRLRDPEIQTKLETLLKPLIERNKISSPPIKIYISRDTQLNAFALPGGILIFNAGMLAAAGAPEEILGVAAHELAHVTEKHVIKSMIQQLSLAAIVGFFIGEVSELEAFILQQSQMLLQNGFSRSQEATADQVGFDYLVKAGIHPRGMAQFFQRIDQKKSEKNEQSLNERSIEKINSFLSTHPLSAERIRMVEQRMKTLTKEQKQNLKDVKFDLQNFQKLIMLDLKEFQKLKIKEIPQAP